MSTEFAQALRQTDAPAQEQIQYIDIDRIDPDPANFYELSDVDKLAANIELIGLQQPLRVRVHPENPERYMIVSGHRRRAALRQLVEEGKEQYRLAQCIVEQAAASDALQELRLIYANSDTRRMTNAEISKQAERVEMLLYTLKEQGMEFPGRMRDHVAEACKVSKSKLARLKVIREKLSKNSDVQRSFETGKLSEDAAYKMAQLPTETQEVIFYSKYNDDGRVSAWGVEEGARRIEQIDAISCADGQCENRANMYHRSLAHSCYSPCRQCCEFCINFETCSRVCSKLKAHQKKMKAEKKEQEEKKKIAEEQHEKERYSAVWDSWKRLGNIARAHGSSADAVALILTKDCSWDHASIRGALLGEEQALKKRYQEPFADYGGRYRLSEVADLLGVTTDYLLGRSEAPEPPVAQLDSTPVWHDPRKGDLPEEGQEIIAAVQYCPPNGKWTTEDLTFRDGVFMGFGVPLDEGIPLYWQQRFEPPVPESDTEENENEEELT